MSDILVKDIRLQFGKALDTLRGIAEAFPADRWLEIHGDDEFYIPSRIAYHAASYIDFRMMGGSNDPDFNAHLPFGPWMDATAKTLPSKADFLGYYDGLYPRIQEMLTALTDQSLSDPLEPEMPHYGATRLGLYLYMLRELSAHAGELNKMLVEDGLQDVWVNR